MPELPEVEAARRAVHDHCSGKTIIKAMVANDEKVIEGVSPSELEKALVAKKIIAAHRKGKNMWLQLDTPPFPTFQFGMTGAVYIKGLSVTKYKRSAIKDGDEWPSKFSKVFVKLDDGTEMSFTDKRRFARVRLVENPEEVAPISELGPDALLDLMSEDDFIAALSKKSTAIKSLLLDQGFIAGIGNWVADEVLYHARIHPLHVASMLSKEQCKYLHNSIKEVIEKAVEVGADSSQYPENWIFHSREKKPGKAFVDGKKIDFITVGGRTSAYVPDLQKFDAQASGNQSSRKGGNRSKKKGFVIESGNVISEDNVEDYAEEENRKKDQEKRKAPKAGRTESSASAKKSSKKAAAVDKSKKKDGRKKNNKNDSSQEIVSENSEEQELGKEVKGGVKNRGRGKKSAKAEMSETAPVVIGKRKRTNDAGQAKPRKKGASNETDEVESSEQGDPKVIDMSDSLIKTSEKASKSQKGRRSGKLN